MHNQNEIKKILDQGMVSRSIIESKVAMRKCQLYSQMAQDKEVKDFFQKQASSMKGVIDYFQDKLSM
ncbi:MAG: hypothetical protein GX248_03160 [Peptococcaceae bacterium]|jgi:hypothetical protein|nr:hypothetical protein [Peptococcaceae bacterium]